MFRYSVANLRSQPRSVEPELGQDRQNSGQGKGSAAAVFQVRYHSAIEYRTAIKKHFLTILATGAITCRTKKVYRIQIRFSGSEIRRG